PLTAQTYYQLQYSWEEIDAAVTSVRDSFPAQISAKLDAQVSHIELPANPGVPTIINLSINGAPLDSDHGYIFAIDSLSVLRLQAHTTDGSDTDAMSVTIGPSEPDPDYSLTVAGPAIASRWDVAGADFAEYFEASAPIPLGTAVVIDRGLVRPALPGEKPVGITSSGAGFIGNSGRPDSPWLTSALGDTLYQVVQYVQISREVKFPTPQTKDFWVPADKLESIPKDAPIQIRTLPIKNPDFGKTYIPHRHNPNMVLVGLIGQIPLRVGQATSPSWFFIKSLDKDTDLWLVK
ncbi:MAG TPA: peptidase G2 autoproteolytic cleavage domain-containing protein, partial [Candidatus Cloacimonadota bacterium]|nr:peptidase G2 autoproteolytic cleavage domain-containing protein [Candidatus Cloacimonadota bacterium]